jgi:SAM-dependent methyltransferase
MSSHTRKEAEVATRFRERYAIGASSAARIVEERVIGAAWGANGYTTRAQAERLARVLRLRRGMRLLDLGAGRGWPGLYLAKLTGCHVVLADLPREALSRAAARASRERALASVASCVMATGNALPFRAASFDAVTHADVTC